MTTQAVDKSLLGCRWSCPLIQCESPWVKGRGDEDGHPRASKVGGRWDGMLLGHAVGWNVAVIFLRRTRSASKA